MTQTAEVTLPVPVPREVHAAVVPMDPPIADGGRAVVVLSDRTRERAVERMRADFVANVSHELRTPLASLIGFIETLRGPAADDPPAQQRFLGIMGEQAARMNRLIDDLLSLSRIELTEHQPPSGRGRPARAGDAAGRRLRAAAAGSARSRSTCESPSDLPRGDRRRGPADAGGAEPAGQRGEIRPRGRHGAAATVAGAGPRVAARPGVVVAVARSRAPASRANICRG